MADEIRDSAPCYYCTKQLKNFNIKRIVYSNADGHFTAQKCSEYQTNHVSHGERLQRS
jgi:deoxycytidylate deaminase